MTFRTDSVISQCDHHHHQHGPSSIRCMCGDYPCIIALSANMNATPSQTFMNPLQNPQPCADAISHCEMHCRHHHDTDPYAFAACVVTDHAICTMPTTTTDFRELDTCDVSFHADSVIGHSECTVQGFTDLLQRSRR